MANNNRPAWFGPHAILEAVERLVVGDDNPDHADAGYTFEEIKNKLVQIHSWRRRGQQQEIEEEELPLINDFFPDDDTLWVELDGLVQMGDLKAVGVRGDHYKLSPPYLPPWFCPENIVEAVDYLDKFIRGRGCTWEMLKHCLKAKYQPEQPLPPDLDTVLRAMLSVFHQKGRLIITRGANGDTRHYTLRQAPAPAEINPIDIPEYVWCYHLGYKLGATGDALDGDALDGDGAPGDALDGDPLGLDGDGAPGDALELEEYDCEFRQWKVLQNILEHLVGKNSKNFLLKWWTFEEMREFIVMSNEELKDLSMRFDIDARLRATLAALTKRGYLETLRQETLRYKLSSTCHTVFLPEWFSPEDVLEVVRKLDDLHGNDHGSTAQDIFIYFEGDRRLSSLQLFSFDKLVPALLSVLRQRGHLRRGAGGPWHYTRRDAPATIGIPDDNLLAYYAGYKLGGGYGLGDDDDVGLANAANGDRARQRRRNTSATANTDDEQPLLEDSHDADDKAKDRPRREEKEGRRKWYTVLSKRERYTLLRVCFSLFGHVILFALSLIPGFGEEETSKKWSKWVVMDLIAPAVLLVVTLRLQRSYIKLKGTSRDPKTVKWCEYVGPVVTSCSKIAYMAIRTLPLASIVTARAIIAHAFAVTIDMGGAIYLHKKHDCLEPGDING